MEFLLTLVLARNIFLEKDIVNHEKVKRVSHQHNEQVSFDAEFKMIFPFIERKSTEEELLENQGKPMNVVLDKGKEVLAVLQQLFVVIASSLAKSEEMAKPRENQENDQSHNIEVEEEDLVQHPDKLVIRLLV